jgi:hypothetical protein
MQQEYVNAILQESPFRTCKQSMLVGQSIFARGSLEKGSRSSFLRNSITVKAVPSRQAEH